MFLMAVECMESIRTLPELLIKALVGRSTVGPALRRGARSEHGEDVATGLPERNFRARRHGYLHTGAVLMVPD